MSALTTPLLDQISSPEQLRELGPGQLPELARELRGFMIHSVEQTGGHLASSLGVVELTIALHYIYNTPDDRLIWDVGHQSYPHKILTGRREAMATLRQQHGISGFTKRGESPYDPFGAGHSSTSISAALGMAIAAKQRGSEQQTIAVIGDGALTGGMAFEALNHAGDVDANLLVVLNDNDMSISENVGGLSRYLGRILASSTYSHMRETSRKVLSKLPGAWDLARRTEEHVKGMVVPGTLFEELGFNYVGPVDGHDLNALIRALRTLHKLKGPRLLHIITHKGHGYIPAEKDPLKYHGIGRIDPVTTQSGNSVTYTDIFGEWLRSSVQHHPEMIAITPAMASGSGMVQFAEQHPDHFIDVGIAEQHAVTLAAGLAAEGRHPVVAIYSTFLQRAYDQLIHDVALQKLPVLFAIDRAGVVGADGPTHTGAFDISFLRAIPNMVIMTPSNGEECQRMLTTGLQYEGPAAVRYPRSSIIEKTPVSSQSDDPITIGKGKIRRQGEGVALLAFGPMLESALECAETINATVADMRFVTPLDHSLILQLAAQHELLVTLEENVVAGGAGSAVDEFLLSQRITVSILNIGMPNHFVEQGERDALLEQYGLTTRGILDTITRFQQQNRQHNQSI